MTRFLTGPMETSPKVDRVAGKVPHTHTNTQGLQDRAEEEELAENKPNRPKYQADQEEKQTCSTHGKLL